MEEKLIIANCSGFYGDRFSAAQEMVEGGPIDVLTGDYLAELTMAILFRKTLKNPEEGYAETFLKQMETVMKACLSRGIKVVSNAGGLNPMGLAAALKQLSDKLGLSPKIAWIGGDNLMGRMAELKDKGERFFHMDTEEAFDEQAAMTVTSNAYIGGWGITRALEMGADIVVGGRIADASLVSGPAAWKFGWKETDWDRLAGAVAAGHVIECGTHATGGNFPFMEDIYSYHHMGFPIAEIFPDGSSVITKHPGTGGKVSTGTVISQLLYEVRGPSYLTPDVTAHFQTLSVQKEGFDRVRISDAKGSPPTDTLKVCMNRMDGYRNMVRFIITGLDVEKKADILESMFFQALGGRDQFDEAEVRFHGKAKNDPVTIDEAHSFLEIAVKGKNQELITKRFPKAAVEMALGSIPGFTLSDLPGKGSPVIKHWPALIARENVAVTVNVDGEAFSVPWPENGNVYKKVEYGVPVECFDRYGGEMLRLPLGRIIGARSGDKGGNANLGVWVKNPYAYGFLRSFLTVEKLKELLPDTAALDIERYELPNLCALNFYIKGYLGDGVAASLKGDPQAKTLGEYFRCRKTEIPLDIVDRTWNETE
jgi:hypothetical protein